jgi:hypothetical protein
MEGPAIMSHDGSLRIEREHLARALHVKPMAKMWHCFPNVGKTHFLQLIQMDKSPFRTLGKGISFN